MVNWAAKRRKNSKQGLAARPCGAISGPAHFDRLARIYRLLEFAAFGPALERARFCLLDRLASCSEILVLGEGDGRCVERLVSVAPAARIHCVDSSAAMIARATARLARPDVTRRVTFQHADAFSLSLEPLSFDAVVTLFFLDCFRPEQVATLVDRIRPSLRPGGFWLFADFALPGRGWARARARLWLAVLYAFFRWQTGLSASELPPSEKILAAAGLSVAASREFQRGLVRSILFKTRNPTAG